MALGFDFGGNGGGNFLPIIKYDARAGRVFRVDREDGASTSVDITRNFKAVFDFDNMEVGWIAFTAGSAPDFAMVPLGTPRPERPSQNHKGGIRMNVKLGGECGGDCRELASTATAMLGGIDRLHNEFLAGAKANPGKLPVVVLEDTVPITSGSGDKKSTNYQPIFKIVSWVKRPADLDDAAGKKATVPDDAGHEAPAARSAPPATGSTRAAPPAAKAAAPADDEDFG